MKVNPQKKWNIINMLLLLLYFSPFISLQSESQIERANERMVHMSEKSTICDEPTSTESVRLRKLNFKCIK